MFHSIWSALLGGALIGLSASVLLVVDGRIAGISGVVGGLVAPVRGATGWRAAFLAGLFIGAAALLWIRPGAIVARRAMLPLQWVAFAGLLVGLGTQLGGGCTSGHGVCGLSRLSTQSFISVVTFMGTAAVTTFFIRHVLRVAQ